MANKRLKTISPKELNEAFEYQIKNSIWNFYDERAFVENLLYSRFNYLILSYSLFITAFASIDGKLNKIIILALGALITSIVSIAIFRTYVKLDINLIILHNLPNNHVFPIIGDETKVRKFKVFNVNPIMGIILPIILVLSLIVGIILISADIWIIS